MNIVNRLYRLVMVLTLMVGAEAVIADQIRVAVASNFSSAIRVIAEQFEANTEHKVKLIFGSTGKHYAQIRNGAPFDAFFAADARRPQLLESEGETLFGSRFTYAIGKVVLWSPKADLVDSAGEVLKSGDFRYLAIANPKLAPYGKAAQQVMEVLGVQRALRGRTVRGENIGQTFQFVRSGNAQLGFIAYSQLQSEEHKGRGSLWLPDQSMYDPIEQQAVLLRDNPAARSFIAFVQSEEGRAVIQQFGYDPP